VSFDEAINPGSVNSNTFLVTNFGLDEVFGTADDFLVAGSYELRNQGRQVVFLPAEKLENGFYKVLVTTGVTDMAGNAITEPIEFDFEISDLANEAASGTPADPFLQSANVGQLITVEGSGFTEGGTFDFPTRSASGAVTTRTIVLESVAAETDPLLPLPFRQTQLRATCPCQTAR
jgi:hypothetical protein